MEQIKAEAQDFGSSQRDLLRSSFEKGTPFFSENDLLPPKDRGKSFDAATAEPEPEVAAYIDTARKGERMEGTEEFFSSARGVIADPHAQLEIVSVETRSESAPEKLETCQEAGTYQMFLTQRRVVEIVPAVKEMVRQCKGHEEDEKFHLESNAKEHRKKQENQLKHDRSIASSKVHISEGGLLHRYIVTSTWKHRDGIHCSHSFLQEKIVREASEKDSWETDDSEALAALSANHNCRMLYSQMIVGPETRAIDGSSIFRDSWEKRLFFSCGDEKDSKCARLRESGARLYGKKCLKRPSFDEHECDLWEKVYRVSGETVHEKTTAAFEGEPIWGLEGSFDPTWEANADFGPTVTTLSVFSEIKQNIEDSQTDFSSEQAEVFKGQTRKCQRSFVQGVLFDCCNKMDGVAVAAKLSRCSTEERLLAEQRRDGKCRHIGAYTKMMGAETVQVFCCFPTKLARILHEQGRVQIRFSWGSAEHPDCSGFTLHQLGRIDFGQLDLTEVTQDLAVDKDFIQRKIQQVSRDLQTEESRSKLQQSTEENIKRPTHA